MEKALITGITGFVGSDLASQSFVPSEPIRNSNIDPKIQVAGSSEEYGVVYENELPITEEKTLRPLSPYAVSKVAHDKLSYQYNKIYGQEIVVTKADKTLSDLFDYWRDKV